MVWCYCYHLHAINQSCEIHKLKVSNENKFQ